MASPGFEQSDLNFLQKHVFEGIWERYDNPAYRKWVWTLRSYKVFFIIAMLVIFIEFVGSRLWAISRYVVLHTTGKPMRFPDEAYSEPLLYLSRGRAIWSSLPSIGKASAQSWTRLKRRFGHSATGQKSGTPRDDPAQSVWFGIIAIFNIALSISMGVAIPTLLTDGAFGAPIVKSKPIEDCLASNRVVGWIRYVMALPRTDAIFQQCFDEVNQNCGSQYYFTPPHIEKRRLDSCPFPGDICQNQTKPFEISHFNVSAYEAGINSPSKLTLNHRLTCAPVDVGKFQLFPSFSPNMSWVSAGTTFDSPDDFFSWTVELSTVNGPNSLSNQSSGLQMARENGPVDITVLPKHIVPFSLSISEYQELIHEGLRRDDGQSFLIVYRAGRRSTYYSAIDDPPLFAAHNEFNFSEDSEMLFLPDREATALGCVEQYQFCVPRLSGPIFCTLWGHTTQRSAQLMTFLRSGLAGQDQVYFALAEMATFFLELTEASAVYRYLALRNKMHSLSPLLRGRTSNTNNIYHLDEPWTLEVETWFTKAIVNMIFRAKMGAKYHLANFHRFNFEPEFEKAFIQQWATCGRILFRNGDYTNINWIGFCATTATLLLICVISYLIERIHKYGIIVFRVLANVYGTVIKIRSISRYLMRSLRCSFWWKVPVIVGQLYLFWETGPFSNVFRARRTWHGRWHGEASARMRCLDGIDRPCAQTDCRNLNGYGLEDLRNLEDIDNPLWNYSGTRK